MQIPLGEQLRQLRRRDGRTQEDLAEALGVTAQAVSRWETGSCYPDTELLPDIAHYFGVSIDELFGYENERAQKINELAERIIRMNRENNGEDVNMDECTRLARESLVQFPGNEKLMLCLASVLFNAGYVRYGEYHCTDEYGYDTFDTEGHRTYAEWQEAIRIYEKLLTSLPEGEMRHQAVRELIQLYVNIGEHTRASALAETAVPLSGCREFLRLNTCDGRKRAEAYGETLLRMAETCADLMISCVIMNKSHLTPTESAQSVRRAIALFDLVCPDGDYGLYACTVAHLYLYLSEHQWRAGERDGAFDSLDTAADLMRAHKRYNGDAVSTHTSPLLRTVKINPHGYDSLIGPSRLAGDWPWWCVPDYGDVQRELQKDPRWAQWVARISK